eukprot:4362997-Prymnesium_polylepis.1
MALELAGRTVRLDFCTGPDSVQQLAPEVHARLTRLLGGSARPRAPSWLRHNTSQPELWAAAVGQAQLFLHKNDPAYTPLGLVGSPRRKPRDASTNRPAAASSAAGAAEVDGGGADATR